MANLARQIVAFRNKHGLTQDQFGEIVGVENVRPQGTVNAWEHGTIPHPRYLVAVRELLARKQTARIHALLG